MELCHSIAWIMTKLKRLMTSIKTQIGASSEKLFPEAPFFDPTRVVDPRPLAHGSPPPSTAAASSNARPNSVKGSVLIVTSR